MDPDNSFARLVKLRRTALGLSQSSLADLVGRSASAVRSWERGASTPSDGAVVQSLAAVLGVEEKALRESVGLPYGQPVEDFDPIGEGALDLFVDEDAGGDEADEPEAGGSTAGDSAAVPLAATPDIPILLLRTHQFPYLRVFLLVYLVKRYRLAILFFPILLQLFRLIKRTTTFISFQHLSS